ncbi:MAG TPA: tRNA pseudouridine(55) synthase TruB [Candidatus Saccharimonadales bacterium]|nr:tRNA pseudouridine(55) synthase TruB [Candidatus Saccharimonadales bacterium]
MNGILLIDKPREWTSFDAVNKTRRIIQYSDLNVTHKKRFPVGHTGTLDPLATGLLVLLLGKYTKRAPALTKLDKTYEVTMRLGMTSTTGDEEGDKTTVSDVQPSQEAVEAALRQFQGDIMQKPPIYSAIKINGQRAYKLARAGKAPEMEARPATIRSIQLTGYAYPIVTFTAEVSSGTYIRSLVEDIGAVLQTGAYMSDLRRTKVGQFTIANAITIDALSPEAIEAHAFQLDEEPAET